MECDGMCSVKLIILYNFTNDKKFTLANNRISPTKMKKCEWKFLSNWNREFM